jgi:hypothetical protein
LKLPIAAIVAKLAPGHTSAPSQSIDVVRRDSVGKGEDLGHPLRYRNLINAEVRVW